MSTVVSVSPFCEMIASAPAAGTGATAPDPLNNGITGAIGTASNDAIESTRPTPSTVRSTAPSAVRSTTSRPGRSDQSATTTWALSALKSNGTAAALVSDPAGEKRTWMSRRATTEPVVRSTRTRAPGPARFVATCRPR